MQMTTKWRSAIGVLVAICLTLTQVEYNAFGRTPGQNAPAAKVETPPPASAPAPTKKRRMRWLWIGVAAAGAAVAAVLMSNKAKAEPVVTVGGPTVGNPR